MKATEFAKSHKCDADWIAAMGDRDVVVLQPGQRGTYCGFDATIYRHVCNGMYEISVPGGITCAAAADFKNGR